MLDIFYYYVLILAILAILIFIILFYLKNTKKLSDIDTNLGITGSVGKPYELNVSEGNVLNTSTLYKFGYNSSIAQTAEETIWTPGGNIIYLNLETRVGVSSSESTDGSGQTGARKIRVFGVNGDYDEVQEDITLNGTALRLSNKKFLRVFRSFVIEAGTHEKNKGTITISNSDQSTTMAEIPIGESQTQMAVYTVPSGKTLYINQLTFTGSIGSTGNKYAEIKLVSRDETSEVKRVRFINILQTNRDTSDFKYPLKFLEKTDLECRAKPNDTSLISASFEGILIDN